MLLKENDVAKANNTVRSEEISSEIWFIALSYPSLSSLLGRAVRRGETLRDGAPGWFQSEIPKYYGFGTTPRAIASQSRCPDSGMQFVSTQHYKCLFRDIYQEKLLPRDIEHLHHGGRPMLIDQRTFFQSQTTLKHANSPEEYQEACDKQEKTPRTRQQ